jgi:hypothetical protein
MQSATSTRKLRSTKRNPSKEVDILEKLLKSDEKMESPEEHSLNK